MKMKAAISTDASISGRSRNCMASTSSEPKPGKTNTRSTTTTPPIMKAKLIAVALSQGISALGSAWRSTIRLRERPFSSAMRMKSESSSSIRLSRNRRVPETASRMASDTAGSVIM